MADPIKISELPSLASVQPNDILPIVDAALTQTSKATASQIAAIGGGPPGDNTVTTAKIANGAVTAAKTSFTATDRILGRASAGPGNGEEITCTAFARQLLDDPDAATMRATLGALQGTDSPTFTGTVTVNGTVAVSQVVRTALGSASLPSFTFTGDTDTGMFSTGANSVSLSTGGTERLRIDSAGGMLIQHAPSGGMLPAFACRAWVNFNGTPGVPAVRASGNISSVVKLGTAVYRVNFATAMPDTNYIAMCSSEYRFGDPYDRLCMMDNRHSNPADAAQTTGDVEVIVDADTAPLNDRDFCFVAIFR